MTDSLRPIVDRPDIFAHLFFAAGTEDVVNVLGPGGVLHGTLANPDGDVLPFHSRELPLPFRLGAQVSVEHPHEPLKYHFHSEVVATEGEVCFLRLPPAIECTERRASARVQLPWSAAVVFRAEGIDQRWPIFDLSTGGLGFVTPVNGTFVVGAPLVGEVLVGDEPIGAVTVEVRHTEVRGEQRGVGVQIRAANLETRGELARLVARYTP